MHDGPGEFDFVLAVDVGFSCDFAFSVPLLQKLKELAQ
jgi:hypothetical protein